MYPLVRKSPPSVFWGVGAPGVISLLVVETWSSQVGPGPRLPMVSCDSDLAQVGGRRASRDLTASDWVAFTTHP